MEKKIDWVIVLSWTLLIISQLMLYGWIIGKITGWIQTPIWVSYIPHFSGALAIFSIAVQGGKILQQISDMKSAQVLFRGELTEVRTELSGIKTEVATIDERTKHFDKRISTVETDVHLIKQKILR